MADFRSDQAAGLRRLLGGRALQVVTFVAGNEGVGRSVAVANIGVALARLGKEVLIIDEHSACDDIASSFGLAARYDLLHVIEGDMNLGSVLLEPMAGLRVLPASRAIKRLGGLSANQQRVLINAMSHLERAVDVILVDASVAHPAGFSPFGLVSQDVVVVLSANGASIKEAYTLIKRVSQAFSRKYFRILVNKVRQPEDARAVFENLAQVAMQRGVAHLEFAGVIPHDESLKKSVQLCRPVLFQAPDCPAADAFRDMASELLYWQNHAHESTGVEEVLQQLLHLSQRLTPSLLRA